MDGVTVSLAIGLIVSLAVTEIFGITAGGMIVPGYFALSVNQPLNLLVTLLVAAATYGILKFLSQHMIVFGRRRVVLALLFGFLIGTLVRGIGLGFFADHVTSTGCVIGFIIPGLVALWFDRQGMTGTLGSLATSTVLVRLVLITIGVEAVI